ncbi:MAG TPA: hypothetical protein VLA75_04470, partial [Thermoanaerobaculia bacterium]|nr:hypothetical protein [Thermoanaerobaculia bacterium]
MPSSPETPLSPPPRERRRLLRWAAVLALVAGLRAAQTWLASYDDAYITYVFARSFAAGEGLAWHGERVLGTSSPFTAVLLGTVSRATGLAVPVAGHLLSWLALWATGVALLFLTREERIPRAGPVAALLWMIAPATRLHLGSELLPAIACVAGAAAAFAARRDRSAGLLLAAAFAFRAEAGLAAPLLALAVVGRDGPAAAWRRVARAAGVAIAATAAWLAALATLQGGALLPRTLAAKQAQAASSLGIWPGGWEGLGSALARTVELLPGPIPIVLLALTLLALVQLARLRPRPGFHLALLAWGALHMLLIVLLAVGFYPWYALPLQFALLLLLALAAGGGTAGDDRGTGRAREAATWLLLGALVGPELMRQSPAQPLRRDSRQEAYGRAAELFGRYPEGSRVAAYEVGYLGWASAQRVSDLLGLVSPEVPLDFVRAGDLAAARRHLDPDLLMLPLNGGSLFGSSVGDAPSFV